MNYDMTTPCKKCPFRRGTEMLLDEGRIIEIEALFGPDNGGQGGDFPCHETLDYDDGDARHTDKTGHCAGALIYAEQQDSPTQMMRICERLGMYDYRKLADSELVWGDLDEWLENGRCD